MARRKNKLSGRKDVHVRFIRRSYRMRGRVVRMMINTVAISVVLVISA